MEERILETLKIAMYELAYYNYNATYGRYQYEQEILAYKYHIGTLVDLCILEGISIANLSESYNGYTVDEDDLISFVELVKYFN